MADSVSMYYVLKSLDSKLCTLEGVKNKDMKARADKMIQNAAKFGVPGIIDGATFVEGNESVNTLFIAMVFSANSGL